MTKAIKYQVDERGFFGAYGGAFIPIQSIEP